MKIIKDFFANPITLIISYSIIEVGNEKVSFPMILAIPLYLGSMQNEDFWSILIPITGAVGLLINILRVFKIKFISTNRLFVIFGVVLLSLSIVFYYIGSGEKYSFHKPLFSILPEFLLSISSIVTILNFEGNIRDIKQLK